MWKKELKVKIRLPKRFPPTPTWSAVFPLLTSLNLQGLHLNNWMKEEKRDNVSTVKTSTIRGISVARINYSK
jgi:hypothetical protein